MGGRLRAVDPSFVRVRSKAPARSGRDRDSLVTAPRRGRPFALQPLAPVSTGVSLLQGTCMLSFRFFLSIRDSRARPRVQVKRTGGRKRYAVRRRCSFTYHTPRLCGLTRRLCRPLRFVASCRRLARVADQVSRVADLVVVAWFKARATAGAAGGLVLLVRSGAAAFFASRRRHPGRVGQVARVADLVARVADLVAGVAGLVARVAGRVAPVADLVARVADLPRATAGAAAGLVLFDSACWPRVKVWLAFVRPGAARALEAGGRAPKAWRCAGGLGAVVLDLGWRAVEGEARASDLAARRRPATADRRAAARGGMDAAG